MQYAKNTSVSSEMSKMNIERTLIRYEADNFAYAMSPTKSMIMFSMHGKQVKFILPLPSMDEFRLTPTGRDRTAQSQRTEWEQACRQRWSALHLVVKAKLEAVECGISVFEDEFMVNIVLPDGQTVSEFMLPQINQAYLTGKAPAMLLLE